MPKVLFVITLLFLAGLPFGSPVAAQGQFSPEIRVGTSVVTRYQIDQRAAFLTLLGADGDIRGLAREQLINENLQLKAANAQGVQVSPEEIQAGVAEFAGRANLTSEQFLEIVESRGISPATVRDFFTAGVAWRETIRARFGEELRAIVDQEDARRGLALNGTEGGLRILLSEIVLPAGSPEDERASLARANQLAALPDEEAFTAAARRFSITPSAPRGGSLDWLPPEELPEEIRGTVTALAPGQISRPVKFSDRIGVFLLRDREEVAPGAPTDLALDYALFTVAGGRTEAAAVASRVDVCDDFYGIAKGLPAERLVRETRQRSSLPPDIRAALAPLDEGETSLAVTRGGSATVLMLCQIKPVGENTVDLQIAGNRILNTRLGTAAVHYLAQLRAEADIVDLINN